jgi:hypothetical protein
MLTLAKKTFLKCLYVLSFFPTTSIKVIKLQLQKKGARLVRATHLDQSNYLANQTEGATNEYDLTLFIRLFQGSESCAIDQGHSSHPVSSLDLIAVPHPRFLLQGHILSIIGDAISCNK